MAKKKQSQLEPKINLPSAPNLQFPLIITILALLVLIAGMALFAYLGIQAFSQFLNLPLIQPPTHSLCKGTAGCWTGNVTRVVDGDTLVFEPAGAESERRVRLALANTQEKNESDWAEATSFTTARCLGKEALIDQDDKQMLDRYGRTVALVYCGEGIANGKSLNEELLSFGLATIWQSYCAKSEFRNEPWARANGC